MPSMSNTRGRSTIQTTGKFLELTLQDWSDIHRLAPALPSFVFRGQADASWNLSTSLERCFLNFSPAVTISENREHWILHEFRRRYHLYSSVSPAEDNPFEWLAVLQHHGCPTRLLDFTQSLYVATWFALSDAVTDTAIWAVNYWTLRDRVRREFKLQYQPGSVLKDEINRYHIATANEFIAKRERTSRSKFVIRLEPLTCTQRQSAQQGLFLMPTSPTASFMQNLFYSFKCPEPERQKIEPVELESLTPDRSAWDRTSAIDILKIVVPKRLHAHGIEDLVRMNITAETLFPGLDGLARSFVQTIIRGG